MQDILNTKCNHHWTTKLQTSRFALSLSTLESNWMMFLSLQLCNVVVQCSNIDWRFAYYKQIANNNRQCFVTSLYSNMQMIISDEIQGVFLEMLRWNIVSSAVIFSHQSNYLAVNREMKL